MLPAFHYLSPAVGLATASADLLVSKLLRCPAGAESPTGFGIGLGCSADVSRELFSLAGSTGAVRPSNNRSLPAAHLDAAQLGTITGLALSGAAEGDARAALRTVGVTSNRVNGAWTGVSLARYLRLIALMREAVTRGGIHSLAMPLIMRFVWERARDKSCLLRFLDAVHERVPGGILVPSMVTCENARAAFVASCFTPEELSPARAREAALHSLAAVDQHADTASAEAVEIVAASLCRAHAFKPALTVLRHGYDCGKDVPDCVEVVLREIFDLLLFDTETMRFDAGRLPARTCSPALLAFYTDRPDPALAATHADSEAWFDLCQNLAGCEYLSLSPHGRQYELRPGLHNVSRVLGRLLLGDSLVSDWERIKDLENQWNRMHSQNAAMPKTGIRCRAPFVHAQERAELVRSLTSDLPKRREIALLQMGDEAQHFLEVSLEPDHNIATAIYHRRGDDWADERVRSRHLEVRRRLILSATCGLMQSSPTVCALWPGLLGDRMLREDASGADSHVEASAAAAAMRSQSLFVTALLSARWHHTDAERWSPLEERSNVANASVADAKRIALRHVELCELALHTAARSPGASILMPWLLREASTAELEPLQIVQALSNAPAAVTHGEAVHTALTTSDAGRAALAMLDLRCKHSEGSSRLMLLFQALCHAAGWRRKLQLFRFCIVLDSHSQPKR